MFNLTQRSHHGKTTGLLFCLMLSLLIVVMGCAKQIRQNGSGVSTTVQTTQSQGRVAYDSYARSGRAYGYRRVPSRQPSPTPQVQAQRQYTRSHNNLPHREINPLATRPAIQEADLYRVQGTLLYYLHTYRGLTVFDLQDPDHPKRLASLPVYGTPVEMFVEGNVAYVLINQAMRLQKTANGDTYQELYKAQLLTVDISKAGEPEILDTHDIPGTIREGTTRKRGDLIYTVSHRPARSWYEWKKHPNGSTQQIHQQEKEALLIQSYHVGKANQIKLTHTAELPQAHTSYSKRTGNTSETHSYTRRYILTATDQTIIIGELWSQHRVVYQQRRPGRYYGGYRGYYRSYYNYYRSCDETETQQYTKVSIFDIHDQQGRIKQHTQFSIEGHLSDQFKQTAYTEKDGKTIYLGITLQQAYEYRPCATYYGRSKTTIRNTIVSVDITEEQPRMLSQLSFGKPRETVRGSVFDLDRRVAYVITAVRRDPLYAISFENPNRLYVHSEIDGLSGDIQLFRLLEYGQFLLAVGRDTSNDCKGFGQGWWKSNVAVSLFDVRDLRKVRLIQRRCVSIQGATQTYSGINQNRDQAHKMIGMHKIGQTHILTIPFQFYSQYQVQRYGYMRNAVSIMRWDLRHYDPKQSHREQNVLENLGAFLHPYEPIKRTVVATLSHKGKTQHLALNLSNNYLSLVDLNDLRQPRYLTSLSISQQTHGVYAWGKVLVEHVTEQRNNKTEHWLQVRKRNATTGVLGEARKVLSLGTVVRVMRWKKKLLVVRNAIKEYRTGHQHRSQIDYYSHEIAIYDLNNPYQPRFRGSKTLPFLLQNLPSNTCYGQCGTSSSRLAYFGMNRPYSRPMLHTQDGLILLNQSTHHVAGLPTTQNRLLMFDFTSPSIRYQTFLLPHGTYRGLVSVDAHSFFVVQQYDHYDQITYIQRWSKQQDQWQRDHWTAIPGHLLHAFPQGNQLQLLSFQGNYYHLLLSTYQPRDASIQTPQRISEYTTSVVCTSDLVYATIVHQGRYWLQIYQRRDNKLVSLYRKPLFQSPFILRYVGQHYLLLQTSYGLVVFGHEGNEPKTVLHFRSIPGGSGLHIHGPLHLLAEKNVFYLAGHLAGILPFPLQNPIQIAHHRAKLLD